MNPISRAIAKAIGVIALAVAGAIGAYAASLSRTATAYAELASAVNAGQKEASAQSTRIAKLEGYIDALKVAPPLPRMGRGATPPPMPAPVVHAPVMQQQYAPKQVPNQLNELLLKK